MLLEVTGALFGREEDDDEVARCCRLGMINADAAASKKALPT
jgi:hypothetical protein